MLQPFQRFPTLFFAPLFAGVPLAAADTSLNFTPWEIVDQPTAPPAQDAASASEKGVDKATLDATPAVMEYGAEGSRWWQFTGGVGNNLKDATDYNLAAGYEYFVVKDVAFIAELGTWYHAQEGDDAVSLNGSVIFRWHFVDTGKWTIFGDIGIGIMAASGEVPEGGTELNFTPRGGAGVTYRLGESNNRLIMGVRWAHFSNARINGDNNNPSRDDVMIFGGLIIPF